MTASFPHHQDYLPVDQEELRDYVHARLKVFYEEELDVPLVLFNEVLDHVLRIDRIFKQQQVRRVSEWEHVFLATKLHHGCASAMGTFPSQKLINFNSVLLSCQL